MGHARLVRDALEREGEQAIERFLEERQAETYWLEFKRSRQQTVPPGPEAAKRREEDRSQLARAISGFGNSDGGVVVWGIEATSEADGDFARLKDPIPDPKSLEKFLRANSATATYPPHPEVEHFCIPKGGSTPGYVVTYIPKAIGGPLRVRSVADYADRYYIRTVSDFVAAPHEVLAGLFGRVPPPELSLSFLHDSHRLEAGAMRFRVTGFLENVGRVVAEGTFLTIATRRPGAACKVLHEHRAPLSTYHEAIQEDATREVVSGAVSHDDIRIAPAQRVRAMVLEVVLEPPFDSVLSVSATYGCSGMWPRCARAEFQPDAMQSALDWIPRIQGRNMAKPVASFLRETFDPFVLELNGSHSESS